MRRGEILGQPWRNVDLDPHSAVPKTWRRDQLEQQMSTDVRNNGDLVFTRADGGPIHLDFF